VVVQGHGFDTQPLRDAAHRDSLEAAPVGDGEGGFVDARG